MLRPCLNFLIVVSGLSCVWASDRSALYGVWGTEAQCSRDLIIPDGTQRWSPFDIREDWIGQGDIWCRLNWSNAHSTTEGLSALAFGLCGEDDLRNYRIGFKLVSDELFLTWDLMHRNGPLKRCL